MFAFHVQIPQAYFVSCYKNQLIRAVRVNNYRESWTRNKCSVLNLRGLERYREAVNVNYLVDYDEI